MSNWLRNHEKTIIVSAFIIPIIIVAVVSISHVTQWYGISNPFTWAIYLSIGIEIAALSSLAAITARLGKNVYFPFIVVTLIQFIGNIFFSYSYIDISSPEFKNWVELVSPFVNLIGIEPTDLIGNKRFLSIFAGGLLPVISLSFLHMLVKFTEENKTTDDNVEVNSNANVKTNLFEINTSQKIEEENDNTVSPDVLNIVNEEVTEEEETIQPEVLNEVQNNPITEEKTIHQEILNEVQDEPIIEDDVSIKNDVVLDDIKDVHEDLTANDDKVITTDEIVPPEDLNEPVVEKKQIAHPEIINESIEILNNPTVINRNIKNSKIIRKNGNDSPDVKWGLR